MAAKKAKKKKIQKRKDKTAGPVEKADPVSHHTGITGATASHKLMVVRGLMQKLNSDNKKTTLAFACDVANPYGLRRPSGIMQLDLDTGGGLPAGGISYISGPDNAGKTYLMYRYMAMCQRLYGDASCVGIVPVESAPDYSLAILAGMKIAIPDDIISGWNRFRSDRGIPEYTADEYASFKEQTGQVVIIRGSTGEEILNAVLESVKLNVFNIIGLDSVSALLPGADAAKDLDDESKRAANASLITKFLLHYYPLTTGLNGLIETTLIFLAQVRANQDRANAPAHMQKYIKPHAAVGAWAGKHGKLLDIALNDGERIWKTTDGKKHIVGKVMHWELEKGKAGATDNVRGEAEFYYPTSGSIGVDLVESVIQKAIMLGLIVEHNKKISMVSPETGQITGVKDIPGMPAFRKMMQVDFEFELHVRREVLAASGLQCQYR